MQFNQNKNMFRMLTYPVICTLLLVFAATGYYGWHNAGQITAQILMITAFVISLATYAAYLFISWQNTNSQAKYSETVQGSTNTQQELNIIKQNTETANNVRTEFLTKMSHEIRTPMNAIIGFSEVLADSDLDQDQQNHVDIIRQSCENLLLLINDIIDFSKLEAGKLNANITECSLGNILAIIESLLRPEARNKGLDFEIRCHDDLPTIIHTDPAKLRQCLINLIYNAIEFTQKGSVCVEVSADQIERVPGIRFDVKDTGIGIDPEKFETIFTPFTQSDEQYMRRSGGTGLGLAITKKLAILLGGDLSVTTEQGKGSVFTLTIKAGVDVDLHSSHESLKKQNTSHCKPEPEQVDQNARFSGSALVAEDSPTNQTLIKLLLEKIGLDVTIAQDGIETVEKALANKFDIIFMDIQMPRMSGYDATRKLRENNLTTPIIALTANAMHGDDEKCYDAGCDEYLTKPIDRKRMIAAIAKYLAKVQQEEACDKVDNLTTQVKQLQQLCVNPEMADRYITEESINWDKLVEACGNEDTARTIAEAFIEDSPQCISSLAQAVKNTKPRYVQIYAHSLKGAALQIYADDLSQKSQQLEQAAKEKKVDVFASLFEDIQNEYNKVVPFVNNVCLVRRT